MPEINLRKNNPRNIPPKIFFLSLTIVWQYFIPQKDMPIAISHTPHRDHPTVNSKEYSATRRSPNITKGMYISVL